MFLILKLGSSLAIQQHQIFNVVQTIMSTLADYYQNNIFFAPRHDSWIDNNNNVYLLCDWKVLHL